jgi:hypothetical protein
MNSDDMIRTDLPLSSTRCIWRRCSASWPPAVRPQHRRWGGTRSTWHGACSCGVGPKYGSAYTTAFAGRGLKKILHRCFYISGAGVHLSRRTRQLIEGSPARALNVFPPFDDFYFIDVDPEKTAYLMTLCKDRRDVDVSSCPRFSIPMTSERPPPARSLLPPPDWEVMRQAGKSRARGHVLKFPSHDMNRNAIWLNTGRSSARRHPAHDPFLGKQAAYAKPSDFFLRLILLSRTTRRSLPPSAIA